MKVFYNNKHNGGGLWMAEPFTKIVKRYRRKYNRVCEFCSGPGFIGFEILLNGLCESICLVDVNPEVEENIRKTIDYHKLQGKVNFYLSDCLDHVPETEKWDLIVSNPPHANEDERRDGLKYKHDRIWQDKDWSIHQRFYSNVKKYMNHNALIIMIENHDYSTINDFWHMSYQGGLEIKDSFVNDINNKFYYIILKSQPIVRQNHDEPPC